MARFPDAFVWGTATAAYQIEGAATEDGRGASIWDTFSHTPGKTFGGDTGDVACDHYHRYPADVALMQEFGMRAYRFSLAWPRILPAGTGNICDAGLDFYDKLVDTLLEANITPFGTLYHWDLPQTLQDQGGWTNRATADAFAHYSDIVARRLGDRVKHWITLNEPWCSAFLGYALGEHAPGLRDHGKALAAAHTLLVAHGKAVSALRAAVPDAQVGITLNLAPGLPATDGPDDEAAAQRFDGFMNRWFLDPIFGRGYPQDLIGWYRLFMPRIENGDLDVIAAPLDFLGINYYSPIGVRAASIMQNPLRFTPMTTEDAVERGYEITAMGWPVDPQSLADLLVRVQRDYAPPAIYITENGAAFDDAVVNGQICDERRVAYLREHFRAAHQAIAAGVPLRGYFVWSFMDNFEWTYGYAKRFGIVHVDYQTQRRTPKKSAFWYRQVIAANAVED